MPVSYTPISHQLPSHEDALASEMENILCPDAFLHEELERLFAAKQATDTRTRAARAMLHSMLGLPP